MTIFLQAILAPMSWRKVHFGNSILWCGWQLNLDIDTISLAQNKLAKLQAQLQERVGDQHQPPPAAASSPALPGPQQPARHHVLRLRQSLAEPPRLSGARSVLGTAARGHLYTPRRQDRGICWEAHPRQIRPPAGAQVIPPSVPASGGPSQ